MHFNLSHKIKLDQDVPVMPQTVWINIHKYYNSFTMPPEFIFGDSKFGSYTLSTSSLMILAVLIVLLVSPSQTSPSTSTQSTICFMWGVRSFRTRLTHTIATISLQDYLEYSKYQPK